VIGPDRLLIFPNRGLNALQVFDPASRTIVRTIPLPAPYSYTTGGAMLATALVRADGSILTNVRDGAGTATALKLTGTGNAIAARASGAEFLQQIAFDPADADRETVIGGTPFLPEVRAVSPAGSTSTSRITRTGANFIGIVTAANGDIYAGTWCGPDNGAVLRYDSAGSLLGTFAAVGDATGSCEVNGLARDPEGNIYVAQNSSNRIARFDSTGTFSGFITAPSFANPSQVFFDPRDNLLYVGNDADDRLTILTPQGTTIAVVRMGGSGVGVPGPLDGSNAPPVADAGPDQVVPVGGTVQLDGSGSADPDDQPLTYTWILNTKPAGSTAQLSATNIANPTFVADLPGTYIAQLVVNDGQINSPSDTVAITTENRAPIANAGPDQSEVPVGATVDLNGSSSNDPDGHPITYQWALVLKPAASAATLVNANTSTPSFVADRGGLYRVQLIVSDAQVSSAADTVDVVTVNQAPTASAGPDQNVLVGTTVQLSGSGSSDPDDNPLTFQWTLFSKPAGSNAALSDAASVSPTFVSDIVGSYTVRLVVHDGFASSPADELVVNATSNAIALALEGTPLVGVARPATLRVTLPTPAPPGGAVVSVASDDAGIVTVGPPASVTITEGATIGQVTLTGVTIGSTVIRASAEGYTGGSLSVTVTNNVLSVPTTLNVAFGQTASLPVSIPQAAPAGGIEVTVSSADASRVEVMTPTVTIPEGALAVNATVRGAGFGTTMVSATNAAFATGSGEVSSTGALNITQVSASFRPAFPTDVTVRLESQGSAVAAPAPGLTFTLTAADPSCLSVPAQATIGTGLVSTSVALAYGGSASLPCTTTLTVSSGGLTNDTINVTVNPNPGITLNGYPLTVGAGLQTNFNPFCCGLSVQLNESQHGGTTVTVTSANPAVALVSPDASTPGAAEFSVPLANGSTGFSYYVHGVAPGSAVITATATRFQSASGTANVVQAAYMLSGPPATTTKLSVNSDFQVAVGIPTENNSTLWFEQSVRAGVPLTANVTVSNGAVAQLVKQFGVVGTTLSVAIPAGSSRSPFGLAAGGIAFDPLDIGSTGLSVQISGLEPTAGASATITVNQPVLRLQGLTGFTGSTQLTVGAGLQTNFNPYCCALSVVLDAAQHGGSTVTISSSNFAVAGVSANAATAASASIDVFVPNGQTSAAFYVHGMSASIDPVTITASAEGKFSSGSGTVRVVQPAVRLIGPSTATTSQSPNQDFVVAIGTPVQDNSSLFMEQPVRAGQTVTATVSNGNADVARLLTPAEQTDAENPSVTVTIAANQSRSAGSFAAGGVTFDPIGGGTTTVAATIPGFISTAAATVNVQVNAPALSLRGVSGLRIGAGLQTSFNPFCCSIGIVLDGSQHGGTTVTITSLNPALAEVAPNGTTAGETSIQLQIPNGQTTTFFYIQGVEGAAGNVAIRASAPGFTATEATVTVEQPALRLFSLPTSTTTLATDSNFFVGVGLRDAAGSGLLVEQDVRPGGSVTATVTNSASNVANLKKGPAPGDVGQSLTIGIPANSSRSAQSFASGGLTFDPIGAGSTTVAATIPGFFATTAASTTVSVSAPALTLSGLPVSVGSGLRTNFNPFCCQIAVSLGAAGHQGVTVTITSSNPDVLKVAGSAAGESAASVQIQVPAGGTSATFYVEGVDSATGTVSVQASAPGFTDGSGTVTVVQPALRLFGPASTTTLSSPAVFQAAVGIPDATNSSLLTEQPVRPGATLTVTVTNSNASVAQLLKDGESPAQALTVHIAGGQTRSPATLAAGGIAFDPLNQGSTTVTGAIPGHVATAAAATTVTVSAPPITLQGVQSLIVGAGLQANFNPFCCSIGVALGVASPVPVTVDVTSLNPSIALVSADGTSAGSTSIQVVVPANQTFAAFYVQGVALGGATIRATAPAYAQGEATLEVVPTGLRIDGLATSIDATAGNDPFVVTVGPLNAFGTDLQFAQPVRGGTSVTVNVSNSNADAAQLVKGAAGAQQWQVIIGGNQSSSPATAEANGVEFDPIAAGSTTVTATPVSAGVLATDAATVNVEVTSSLVGASTKGKPAPPKKKGAP
jgi:hypothetical protein